MKKDKRLEAIKEDCYNMSSSLTKKIVLALCKEGLSNLSYADYFAKVIERAIKENPKEIQKLCKPTLSK